MRTILHTITILSCLLVNCSVETFATGKEHPDGLNNARVKVVVAEKNLFVGKPFVIDFVLDAEAGDIAGLGRRSAPDFGGLKWSESSVRTNDSAYQNKMSKNNRPLIPIARYIVQADNEGEFEIDPGQIVAEVYSAETRVDPFWGTRYRVKKQIPLQSEKKKIKILQAPSVVESENLPIGEFEGEWLLPPGKIVPGQEGIVVLKVSGFGDLRNSVFPDLHNAFSDKLRYVGMTPDVNVVVSDGRIFSTAELVFTFEADESGVFMLNPVDLKFYSSDNRRKKSVKIKPIEISIDKSSKIQTPLRFEEI